MDALTALLLLLLLPLLAFAALMATLQAALVGVREENLEKLVQRHAPGARRLAHLLLRPAPLSLSLALAESAALITAVVLATGVAGGLIDRPWASAVLGGLVILVALFLLRGLAHIVAWPAPERAALRLVWLAALLVFFFRPITSFVSRIREYARNGASQAGDEVAPPREAQEREGPTFQGHEVEEREHQMIRAILRLEDTPVREIMVPLPDMAAVEKDTPISAVIDLVTQRGFSRIPIYDGSLDRIVGVVYAKDLLAALHTPEKPSNLVQVSRQPFLIPETKRLDELLRDFQERRVHIGIVVDEYGGVAGLVTIEDILEEIVGEIEDEYDTGEPQVERLDQEEAIMDAKVPLDLLNELFTTEIEGSGFDTIGGFIYHQLGKIAVPGDSVVEDGIRLDVLTTVGRRIRKVRVRRLSSTKPEAR